MNSYRIHLPICSRLNCLPVAALLVLLSWALTLPALGQNNLHLINARTEVSNVSFKGHQTFSADLLTEQIATKAPAFFDRLRFWQDQYYPLQPLELQKDVVRLRRFYQQRGFLHPGVDYVVSYDSTDNTAHVLFTINRGAPLITQAVTFLGSDSTRAAFYQFPPEQREAWVQFRRTITERIGGRFQSFHLVEIENEIQRWLQNQGYAFAQVQIDTSVTHLHTTSDDAEFNDYVDITIQVDAGPLAYITRVNMVGNESLSREVLLKAIPFEIGDRFSQQTLTTTQQQLFSLNLFRMVLVDIPPQPRDSSVTVRLRFQEAKPRYVSAETGYSLSRGIDLEAQWRHRNFLGNARTFTAAAHWSTGLGSIRRPDLIVPNRWRLSLSLRQPYLFVSKLSGLVSPFIERRQEQAFSFRQIGINSTLIYNFYQFRTLSAQHTLSRARPLGTSNGLPPGEDFYNKSILNISGQFGKTDNYLNPSNGFLLQPFAEIAGQVLASDVNYIKTGIDASLYDIITRKLGMAARLSLGFLQPFGQSLDQNNPVVAAQFRDIRFYAGGPASVRGWYDQLLGPKQPNQSGTRYIPLGGQTRVVGNTELRLPFPGLSADWGTTLFLDFGRIGRRKFNLSPSAYRYGAGGGARYNTPVGPIRLDLAFKLNASEKDLRPPTPPDEPPAPPSFWRRFAFYFSIGNPF